MPTYFTLKATAAKQAAKADKKGKKGLSVEVPEGEAAGDMPSKDTEPAVVNVELTAACCFFLNHGLGLFFGAHEEDFVTLG